MLEFYLLAGLVVVGLACLIPLWSVRRAQGSISAFFLHNEDLALGPLVGTIVASNLSLGNMVFICAIVGYFFGWSGVLWVFLTIVMLAVGFLTFGNRFRAYIEQKGNFGTIHDFIASSHGGKNQRSYNALKQITGVASCLSLLLAIIVEAHLGTQFIGLVFDVPHALVVGGFCFLLVAYTAHGGFQSVVWTDVLQSLLMLFAIIAGIMLFGQLPPGTTFVEAGYDGSIGGIIGGVGWPTALGLTVLGFCWLVSTPDTWQRNCASRSLDTSLRGAVIGCLIMCISVALFAVAGMLVKTTVEPLVLAGQHAAEYSNGAFPLTDIFLLDFDALPSSAAPLAAIIGIGMIMAAVSTTDTFLVVIGHVLNVDLALSSKGIRSIGDLNAEQNRRIVTRGRALILVLGIVIVLGWLVLSNSRWLGDPLNLFFVTYTLQFALFWPVITASNTRARGALVTIMQVVISSVATIAIGWWGMNNLDGKVRIVGLGGTEVLALLPTVPLVLGAIIYGTKSALFGPKSAKAKS